MKKGAIIFDIDGTAVDSPKQKLPTVELVNQVQRLKSNYVMSVATGRVWSFVKDVLKELNLEDPCVISAGTQICNPKTGEILWQKNLPVESLNSALHILKEYPEYKILYNDGTEDDYFHGGISPLEFTFGGDIYFFEQVFVPEVVALEIYDKLSKIDNLAIVMVVSQKPGCKDIHIINKDATKEAAIEQLLKMIGQNKENSIGIGDGNNDIHLFNAVGLKVAMGNGVEVLKQEADIIIDRVDENGLAKYFANL